MFGLYSGFQRAQMLKVREEQWLGRRGPFYAKYLGRFNGIRSSFTGYLNLPEQTELEGKATSWT